MVLDAEQGSEGDARACRHRLVVANAALRQKASEAATRRSIYRSIR
ncbi:MAG: hypothetical protein ACFB21_05705 [Opitutales bacterium]